MTTTGYRGRRLSFAAAGLGLVTAMALSTDAAALCAARTQLSGVWTSEDGATYDMRLISGGEVWWVGRSADGGRQWMHVFKGVLDGNTITGEWVDVHVAGGWAVDRNQGTLTLRLIGERTALKGFTRVSETGGFGPTRWTFPCRDN